MHAAGVFPDGGIDMLSAERFAQTFAPKADAALHLHELTEGVDLSAFVLFSSIAGVLGGGGQGSYAAANAFLDALAEYAAGGAWSRRRWRGGCGSRRAARRRRTSSCASAEYWAWPRSPSERCSRPWTARRPV